MNNFEETVQMINNELDEGIDDHLIQEYPENVSEITAMDLTPPTREFFLAFVTDAIARRAEEERKAGKVFDPKGEWNLSFYKGDIAGDEVQWMNMETSETVHEFYANDKGEFLFWNLR